MGVPLSVQASACSLPAPCLSCQGPAHPQLCPWHCWHVPFCGVCTWANATEEGRGLVHGESCQCGHSADLCPFSSPGGSLSSCSALHVPISWCGPACPLLQWDPWPLVQPYMSPAPARPPAPSPSLCPPLRDLQALHRQTNGEGKQGRGSRQPGTACAPQGAEGPFAHSQQDGRH